MGAYTMLKRLKSHYHWLIAAVVFLETIVLGGLINCYGIFTSPICEDLGVSRGSYAIATMPYTLASFFSTMFTGFLLQRFGYKKCALVSLGLVVISQVITSTAGSLTAFALGKILMGVGYGVCMTAGAVRIIQCWFEKHQGLVCGAVTMATGLGGSLMTIILNAIIESSGWRAANFAAGVMLFVVAITYLLLRDKPEMMGLKPFGYGEGGKKPGKVSRFRWEGTSLKDIMKRPSFYIMNFCILASCLCIFNASFVVVPYYQDLGYTPAQAASYQSIFMLTLAIAKLLCGGLCDRFGAKIVGTVCMVFAVAGQLCMTLLIGPVFNYLGVMIFAVGLCMTSIMIPLLAEALFGYKPCIVANGIFLAMPTAASLISNPISNLCYDTLGSYQPIFLISAIVNGGITVLYLVLYAMAEKDRRKIEQTQREG